MTSPLSFLITRKTFASCYGNNKSKIAKRQNRGISPVIATTIILAITIVLGLALWGFANSGVGSATVQYSEAIEEYGDIVRNHRFVIANVHLDANTDKMAVWLYNNGKLDTTISGDMVFVICKDAGCTQPTPDPTTLGDPSLCPEEPTSTVRVCDLPAKELRKFVIDMPIETGATYEISVVSDMGLTQTYIQESS